MDCEAGDYSAAAHQHRRENYKIINEEDIKHLQENDISQVSGVLSVPRGVACALLCRNNWSPASVYDNWFAAAGGERNPNPGPTTCKICSENNPLKEVVSATCSHPICCVDCWKSYIATVVSAAAACLTLHCPAASCGAVITPDVVQKLAPEADIVDNHRRLRRSYVESNRNRDWCPAAGCGRAIEFEGAGIDMYDVVCDCSHKFCWRCRGERHRPLNCKAAADWAEKIRAEGESTNWIIENTTPCPNCYRPVQKFNDLGNWIICAAPCGLTFCWICASPWEGHGGGGFCRGSVVSGGGEREEEERRKKKAKKFSDRFIHCYERWEWGENSRKKAMAEAETARKEKKAKFVVEAWEQMVECWHVMKWSYVYGYYMGKGGKKAVLEHFQAEEETAVERLRHCVGEGCEESKEYRLRVMGLTSVTAKYFQNFVSAMEAEFEFFGV